MAKSPIELKLTQRPKVETLEQAVEIIKILSNELMESYRLLRGDIRNIEQRLDDGGL